MSNYFNHPKTMRESEYNYISFIRSQEIYKKIINSATTNKELIEIYNELDKCDCCKRHTSGRPIKCIKDSKNTQSLYLGGPNKIQMCLDKTICDCSCRQLMRMIVLNID